MDSTSNRVLTILLIAALFVSVFGTLSALNRIDGLEALTGLWGSGTTTRGSTNITITSQTVINFTADNVTFGTGYVTAGFEACIMDSIGTTSSGCTNFPSTLNANLTLENMGNTNVRLNLSNVNYSASFIGGANPGYAFKWNPLEANLSTCTNGTSGIMTVADFGISNTWRNITNAMFNSTARWCDVFNATDSADTLGIAFRVLIPSNAPARTIGDIFTATAVAIPT